MGPMAHASGRDEMCLSIRAIFGIRGRRSREMPNYIRVKHDTVCPALIATIRSALARSAMKYVQRSKKRPRSSGSELSRSRPSRP